MFTKKTIITLVVFILSFIFTSEIIAKNNGSIPKNFWGIWYSPEDCKVYKKTKSRLDSIIEIKAKEVDGWEDVCELVKINSSSSNTFSGIFSCAGEGETWKKSYTFSLKTGKLYTNQGHNGLIPCD